MDRIWANRVEAGTKTFSEVPEARKEAVGKIIFDDVPAKISPEKYEEIMGIPYPVTEEEVE